MLGDPYANWKLQKDALFQSKHAPRRIPNSQGAAQSGGFRV